ncbi:MAG: hypothetical protein HY966_04320 [Ignavibacteriales bacterium]|nr:hypothetical protein [Ignavibacteriales bacterium]
MIGMLRFTLLESLRQGTLLFYLAVSTIILLLLLLGIRLDDSNPNQLTLFGMPFFQKMASVNVVEMLLVMLQKQATFWLILFGIIASAGLIPSLLEKGTAELFLSKPQSRTTIYLSRSLGAVTGVAVNIAYFIVGVWLVVGLKLGVWQSGLLLAIIAISFAFACFYSVIGLVALISRNGLIAVMLAFLYTLVSSGLETRAHGLYRLWDNAIYHRTLDVLYYLLPQFDSMLSHTSLLIGRSPFGTGPAEFSILPFVYSGLSATLLYAAGCYYFQRQDY